MPDIIKNKLINKINNSAVNNRIKYKIVANQVKKFSIKGNEAYCVIECPFCNVKVPSSYYRSEWKIATFNTHVKTHTKKDQKSSSTENSDSQLNFERARSSVLQNLGVILQ